jgi:hypothetical protein
MTPSIRLKYVPSLEFASKFEAWLDRRKHRVSRTQAHALLSRAAEAIPRELHDHVKISVVSDGVSVTTGNYWLIKLRDRDIAIAGPVQGLAEEVFRTAPDWRIYYFPYSDAGSMLADEALWDDLHDAAVGLTESRQGGFPTPPSDPHKVPLSSIFAA